MARDHRCAAQPQSNSSSTDVATIKPASFQVGEGINHYFHATLHNRAVYLVAMLTGNIGDPGAGVSTWAGNYKGGDLPGCALASVPASAAMSTRTRSTHSSIPPPPTTGDLRHTIHGEETSYWGMGDHGR